MHGVPARLQRAARRRAVLECIVLIEDDAAARERVDLGGHDLVIPGLRGIATGPNVCGAKVIDEDHDDVREGSRSGSGSGNSSSGG